MKNETEFVKCSKKRYLTAKASKFQNNCIEIMVKQYGLTRYHKEMKPLKNKLQDIITNLFIDEKKSIDEIKEMIKNRNNQFLNK